MPKRWRDWLDKLADAEFQGRSDSPCGRSRILSGRGTKTDQSGTQLKIGPKKFRKRVLRGEQALKAAPMSLSFWVKITPLLPGSIEYWAVS